MSKVAILQSSYIPWKGYFHIIQKVDHFVFLDTAQFTCRDWRNRNRIKTPTGPSWLTVPCNGSQSLKINEVKIDPVSDWSKVHLKSFCANYKRTRYFDFLYNFLENIYLKRNWEYLWQLNQHIIKEICHMLEIKTRFYNSTDFELVQGKNEKIISIVKQLNADRYITGPAAASYIEPKLFDEAGIELEYMDYSSYPEYNQPWGEFRHDVSILDLLFCTGPEAGNYIWSSP